MNKPEFIYIGDPLCSWCYGFGPALDQLMEKYPDYPMRIIMGGLRPYDSQPMDLATKDMIRKHWHAVNRRTGQPFDYAILDEDAPAFVYNTELPCRAVVTVRHLKPEAEWTFFKEVQKMFYAENRNTNLTATYHPLLQGHGIDPEEFDRLFHSEEIRKATNDDFMWVKQVGITGFPTLLWGSYPEYNGVSMGYSSLEIMDSVMKNILAEYEQKES